MQTSLTTVAKNFTRRIALRPHPVIRTMSSGSEMFSRSSCDMFISHRGVETKRNAAGLINDRLSMMGFRPFLDSQNMKPGDRLYEKIDAAIKGCKVGIIIFSPKFCESEYCLHELALIMELKKKVIPIFFNVKPFQLCVKNHGSCSEIDMERFNWALEEAKSIVGITFNPAKGDWPKLLRNVCDAVVKNLQELEDDAEQ